MRLFSRRHLVVALIGASWLCCVGEDPFVPSAPGDAGAELRETGAAADATSSADGTIPTDAAVADVLSDGPRGSTEGGARGIACGSTSCDPAAQVCCAESGALAPGSNLPLRCVPKGTCSGTSPMNIPCDDHADCVAKDPTLPICCAGTSFGNPDGGFILFECTIPTGCTTTAQTRHETMCSGPDDHDSCPVGKTCQPGLLREGYFTCR
jgi:hypothetical protein